MATTKGFDCIAFKRAAQEKIYEQIRGMTPAEEIAWFRRKVESGPFGELRRRISTRDQKQDALHCAEDSADYKVK
jgi:hypothetical protein